MTGRSYLLTAIAVGAFLGCGHFGVQSFLIARQLQARAESMTVRTRLMKHQIGEMEQKLRVLQRVAHFVERAHELRLAPESWSTYEVNVQEAMTFEKLSHMIEQCRHGKDIIFKPTTFHVALHHGDGAAAGDSVAATPVPLDSNATKDDTSEVGLALQGAFVIRH